MFHPPSTIYILLNGGLNYPGADFIMQRIKYELDRSGKSGEWVWQLWALCSPFMGMHCAFLINSAIEVVSRDYMTCPEGVVCMYMYVYGGTM